MFTIFDSPARLEESMAGSMSRSQYESKSVSSRIVYHTGDCDHHEGNHRKFTVCDEVPIVDEVLIVDRKHWQA